MVIRAIRGLKVFNRRQQSRQDFICVAKCNIVGAAPAEKLFLANLLNISEGGALLVTVGKKIPAKTKLDLEFQLPGCARTLSVTGEAVRVYKEESERFFKTGIRFLGLKDKDLEEILNFMSRQSESEDVSQAKRKRKK
jgi:c-di-GMP-binding flagellar brake protein YcgR